MRNLERNRKCCVKVERYQNGVGKAVLWRGTASAFSKDEELVPIKTKLEAQTGWTLDKWRLGKPPKDRVDCIIVFSPGYEIVTIGEV